MLYPIRIGAALLTLRCTLHRQYIFGCYFDSGHYSLGVETVRWLILRKILCSNCATERTQWHGSCGSQATPTRVFSHSKCNGTSLQKGQRSRTRTLGKVYSNTQLTTQGGACQNSPYGSLHTEHAVALAIAEPRKTAMTMGEIQKMVIGKARAWTTLLISAVTISTCFSATASAKQPTRGGILKFVVGSKIPSYDAHQEVSFGMLHPIRPFYSLLIRVDPENPQDPSAIICDLCEGKWTKSGDGKTYTFKIKKNVRFHDGTLLTSADIKATFDKIIFPPMGIPSARQSFYSVVESITTPDEYTIAFQLKKPLNAFIAALASPFNFIYSQNDLKKHGYSWHKRNINGTGAFEFVQHQAGSFVEGKRNSHFHIKSLPYLDGFRAIEAPKMSVRLQAIRGGRADIEFRGFPPKARDDMIKVLGDKIKVQESSWNIAMGIAANQRQKQFQDPRVRQALSYALDRWNGAKHLSEIAIIKNVGTTTFPDHPLAPTKKWMEDNLPGYSTDVKHNRAMARKLISEAGHKNLKFTLLNRAIDQPYKLVGTWYIDQWRKVGIDVSQKVVPTGPFYAAQRRTRDYDVAVAFQAGQIVNPTIDVSRWISTSNANYTNHKDIQLDNLYFDLLYETDAKEQHRKLRLYEKRLLGDQAHFIVAFWYHKINLQRSYVKGWKIAPNHYVNQSLDRIWIDPTAR